MAKKMTLDRLAVITQREFRVVHSDVSNLRGEVSNLRRDMESGFRTVADTLELIRQDFVDMKRSFSIITHAISSDVAELRRRVERLERKIGLAR